MLSPFSNEPVELGVLEALPVAVAVLRADRVVFANERMKSWFGGVPTAAALAPVEGRADRVAQGDRLAPARRLRLPGGDTAVVIDPDVVAEGDFLGIASHDLRGSIANVRSFAALLKSRCDLHDEKSRRALEVIVRNADKALRQVRDVFDVLRHRVGALPIECERLDPSQAVRRAATRIEPSAAAEKVTLELVVASQLPAVDADSERLTHALDGFLEHGLARSPEGGRLVLSAGEGPGQLYVGVTDVGVPPTAAELREAFSPSRVVREHRLGSAFQLCLAHDEIQSMGGSSGVTEGADGATTFFFTLPAAAAAGLAH